LFDKELSNSSTTAASSAGAVASFDDYRSTLVEAKDSGRVRHTDAVDRRLLFGEFEAILLTGLLGFIEGHGGNSLAENEEISQSLCFVVSAIICLHMASTQTGERLCLASS
jgi:hypothetical protein